MVNCGAGKRWKGPPAGGTLYVGGGGTDGSLNLPGGIGLKLDAPGTLVGPDDEKGIDVWGAAGGAGRKEGGSDPTRGPVDEKGVIVCEAAKGVVAGLAGKIGRPGFSVPMDYRTNTGLIYSLRSITKTARSNIQYREGKKISFLTSDNTVQSKIYTI